MPSSRDNGGHRANYPLSFEEANKIKGADISSKTFFLYKETKYIEFLFLSERYPKHSVMGINTEMQKESQSFGQTTSFNVLPSLNYNSSKKIESSFAVQNTMDVYAQYAQKFMRHEGDFKLNIYTSIKKHFDVFFCLSFVLKTQKVGKGRQSFYS